MTSSSRSISTIFGAIVGPIVVVSLGANVGTVGGVVVSGPGRVGPTVVVSPGANVGSTVGASVESVGSVGPTVVVSAGGNEETVVVVVSAAKVVVVMDGTVGPGVSVVKSGADGTGACVDAVGEVRPGVVNIASHCIRFWSFAKSLPQSLQTKQCNCAFAKFSNHIIIFNN